MKTFMRFFVLLAIVMMPFHAAKSATKATLKMTAAKVGTAGQAGCHDFEGECLIFQGDPVVVNDFKVTATASPKFEVAVSIYDGAAKALTQLTKTHLGERLAVMVNDKIVQAPTVKAVTHFDGFVLSVRDEASYESLREALEGPVKTPK